ncbi:MAG: hypothetical protein ACREU8_06820 [Gammaproteobacteria bacterium]
MYGRTPRRSNAALPMLGRGHMLAAVLLSLFVWANALAQEQSESDWTDFSIENLMEQKVGYKGPESIIFSAENISFLAP